MGKVEFKNILIVEDNDDLRNSLTEYFSVMNTVTSCPDLAGALAAVAATKFDIVLLDVILPDGNGLDLMETLKETPVIILSDLGSDSNLLEGFTAGATDYIVKPASNALIEIRMALRLLPDSDAKILLHGLALNTGKRTAVYKNTALNLTSSEFNILLFLMQNAGNFYTAVEIYEKIWQMPHLNTETIKKHISNLRKKMFAVSEECASLIISEYGKGYAFVGGRP
ncbi:MAG: response regulator transcription factor [Clostridiales bacterium]|nr:response regulator transcription factor [Clostridiales bacterium]